MTAANMPLSDEELHVLDDFLLQGQEDGERLSLDEAHGYLTALTIAQPDFPAEAWLAAIWGEPAFASVSERQAMTGLLQRLKQDVAASLAAGQRFEPLVIEEEEDGEIFESYDGWCFGFMLAVADHPDIWEGLPKSMQELIQPIAALALAGNSEEGPELDEEEYSLCIELLPGSVAGLYRYFHN